MKTVFKTSAAVCALTIFTAPAFALTAEEVWTKYEEMLRSSSEAKVQVASEVKVGDVLTVSGISMEYSDSDVGVSYTIDAVRFAEQGDGSVQIETSETIPFSVSFEDGGDPISIEFEYTQSDASVIVSGTVDQMNFATTIAQANVNLTEVKDKNGPLDAKFQLSLRDLEGGSAVDADNMQKGTFASKAMAIDFAFKIPESDDLIDGTMIANNLSGSFTGNVEAMANLGKPGADVPEMQVQYGYETLSGQMNLPIEGAAMTAEFSSGASNVEYTFNDTAITGTSSLAALDMKYNVPMMPFPIEVSMADAGGSVIIPVKQDTRGPVEYGFYMRDLVLSDMIWSMFDAGGALPRDPITLEMKFAGEAELGFDLFSLDPEKMEEIENPGKLYAMNLEKLLVKAAGAELTGSGAFTFDNNDLATFDGFPRPMGTAMFNLIGANALLDKLPATGLVSPEDLMPVRMMMGMFAQPGEGPDALKSEIEVNAEAHVLVNGVRMR